MHHHDVFRLPRRPRIFAGPRPIADAESVADIAHRVAEAVGDFRANYDRRLSDLELQLGRQGLNGGPGPDAQARRCDIFNALLRERHGAGARELDADDFAQYQAALGHYFRQGQSALDNANIRASLSVGSDPAGGYTVIPDQDPVPRERLYRTSSMRAVADVLTISSGRFEGVHEKDDDTFGWVGEQESRSETTIGELAAFGIDADEAYALVSVTQRLLDDSAIDMGEYITRRIDRRLMRAENTAFVSGDGVKRPRGFLSYKDTAVTTADESRAWGVLQYVPSGAAGTFPTLSGSNAHDVDALYDLKAALKAELLAGAAWAMNSTTFSLIEKLRDADGRSLVRGSLDMATPDRLLGYPVVIFEDMPDPASDNFAIAFGNFMVGYQIVDKPGLRVLRDPYTTKGKVKFYAYKRVGGDIVNFDAIKLLKFSAS